MDYQFVSLLFWKGENKPEIPPGGRLHVAGPIKRISTTTSSTDPVK